MHFFLFRLPRLAAVRTALLLLIMSAVGRAQSVPPLLNYQGRVVVGSTNFQGTGQFKFALVNAAGTTTLWSNDGTSVGGAEPTAAVSLAVTGGLYSLALGDTALANMTALPASVFAGNADVRLRVWFNDGTNGSQRLSPDQRISSVGYAQLAATVPDGAITAAKLGAGAVGAGNLASGTAGTFQVVNANTTTQPNTSYTATGTSAVNFTLPTTANVGDTVTIAGAGSGGWQLTPGVGQTVNSNGALTFAWTQATNAGSAYWNGAAASADGSHLVATQGVVQGTNNTYNPGSLSLSANGGATWTLATSAGTGFWTAAASSADGSHLAAVQYSVDYPPTLPGSIYTSANGGTTWTKATGAGTGNWYGVAASTDGSHLAAVQNSDASGNPGSIYISADSGVTWTKATGAGTGNWQAVASSADGSHLVAGQTNDASGNPGSIYISADSGVTWTKATSAGTGTWQAAASSADGSRLVAVQYNAASGAFGRGTAGSIYTSADAGATWTKATGAGTGNWGGIASSADGSHLVAALRSYVISTAGGYTSAPGAIFTSADAGATWTQATSAGSAAWTAVASSVDGTRVLTVQGADANNNLGSIDTALGHLTGAKGNTAQFQYLGGGQWTALGQSQLAAGSVGSTQITAGAVGGAQIAAGAVGNTQIAAGAVGNIQLANPSLTISTTGAGLSGGGAVPLGGTLTLNSNATDANTASTLVGRDASGNFAAGTITAALIGNATSATNATNAVNATNAANASTLGGMSASSASTPSTVVSRDANGNFAAGTVTAALNGNAANATTAANASKLGGLAATNANTASTVVNRDASGNFAAGTITANLIGNATSATTATTASSATAFSGPVVGLPATTASGIGVVTLGGNPFLHAYGTSNAFVGANAGNFTMSGSYNTASGNQALGSNTTGIQNTASGFNALGSNTTGGYNTANGLQSLSGNNSGSNNTASGYAALSGNTTGGNNTALGTRAGQSVTTGSNNVEIANQGASGDNAVIRLGTQGTQTATYVAGISGATAASGVAVYVNSSGQLGTLTSSARYKHDIRDLDASSDALLALRPVAFTYKSELDPTQTPQFGLVAEEVERVCPDLVAHAEDGTPYTVRYEAVNAMLLNEFLKEHRHAKEVEAGWREENAAMQQRLAELEAKDKARDERMASLERLLTPDTPIESARATPPAGVPPAK